MAHTNHAETQIRDQIHSWAAALRAKDVDRLVAHYALEAVTADLAPPLWNSGAQTLRKKFEEWLATWVGPIGIETRDVHVTADSEVAFAHASNRIYGTKLDGETSDVWVRATICFRKVSGAWKVAHEHVSVPFYMDGSFRAAVDLKP